MVQGQPGQKVLETPISTNGMHLSFPSTLGSTNRRIEVQAGLSIKCDPISKLANTKRTGGVDHVVVKLLSEHEFLSSIPSTTKKNPKIQKN
jgi:hypothetical protein